MKERKNIVEIIIVFSLFIIGALIIKSYFKPFFSILIMVIMSYNLGDLLKKIGVVHIKTNVVLSLIISNLIILACIASIGFLTVQQGYTFILDIINSYDFNIIFNRIANVLNIKIDEFYNKIGEFIFELSNSKVIAKGAIYTTDSIISYLVALICTYFILTDKYVIFNYASKFINKKKLHIIINKLKVFSKVAKIQLCLILLSMIETIVGFYILHIPYPVTLGIFCGILDIMPYAGIALVFIPLILKAVIFKEYFILIGLLALYFFIIIFRQLLEAKLISSEINVHPLILIIAMYIGMKAFGFIGIIILPICIIFTKELIIESVGESS